MDFSHKILKARLSMQ